MSDETEKYKTMGRRFFAGLIDVVTYIILATALQFPILLIQHPMAYLVNTLTQSVLMYTYIIYMTKRFGGTLGKLYMNIRVVTNETELPISVGQSFRREVLNILTLVPHLILVGLVFSNYSKEQFLKLVNPDISNPWTLVDFSMIFVLLTSEFITALLNSKRRAIHDLIGNTVVVRIGDYRPYSRLIAILALVGLFAVLILTGLSEKLDNMLKSVA